MDGELWKSTAGAIPTSRYNGPVSFVIRDFQQADFDTLWRIDQTCFPPGISYTREELRFYMRRRAAFTLVAASAASEVDARKEEAEVEINSAFQGTRPPLPASATVGFIVAEAAARARGHIITIDVIAAARRFGVGSLLLRAAEDRLITTGCRALELETAVDNISALSFYRRHGFSMIRTLPRYYSNGIDAMVLEKTLV